MDLFGFPFRKSFATHFRIIDRPEVRAARDLSETERRKRTLRMQRAWATAGVAKFAVGHRPREDKLINAVAKIRAPFANRKEGSFRVENAAPAPGQGAADHDARQW